MGHGGTLDPLATGVLILGVGSGTKSLGNFLACTKSYETVLLFGRATDSYDTEGKIVAKKPFEHITKEMVEEAMQQFRGKIMQRPPIFSAVRIDGKRLYEYAREGKEVPREIEERPVTVESLEMMEWMEGGTHPYHWPSAEADLDEKKFVDNVLQLGTKASPEPGEVIATGTNDAAATESEDVPVGQKRKREVDVADPNAGAGIASEVTVPSPKRGKLSPIADVSITPPATTSIPVSRDPCPAPACRIRMTVTSGFYVRSLCHDLGAAVGSLGIMASLIRSRQGDFELGKNVFEYSELAKGEEVWAPQVQSMLEAWTDERAAAVAKQAPMASRSAKGSAGGRSVKQDNKQDRRPIEKRRNSSSEGD